MYLSRIIQTKTLYFGKQPDVSLMKRQSTGTQNAVIYVRKGFFLCCFFPIRIPLASLSTPQLHTHLDCRQCDCVETSPNEPYLEHLLCLINVDLELKVNAAFSLEAKRLIANQMGFIAKTNVSKSKWSFSLIRKALLCIQDIVNTSTVHRPPIHLMSCFDASLDTRDSELLPCSCSASWKLHSMAINVLGSSEEERITQM